MDAIQAANEAKDKENSINLEPAESDEAKSIADNLKIESATDIIQFGTSVQSKAGNLPTSCSLRSEATMLEKQVTC